MKLLIVDDEMYVIQGILKGIDWKQMDFQECMTARSYTQAVEIFKSNKVDIMLCDIEMADQSGLDLVEWVNGHYPQTKCIILSCHDEFHYARRAVRLNCLDYVLKPIPYSDLAVVLQNAIEEVRKEQNQILMENYGKVYIKQMIETVAEDRTEDVVDKVAAYIKTHISENMKVEMLAQMAFISPDHLTRLFKKHFNQTVTEYIHHQRLVLAGELLRSKKMTVTMVASEAGYMNYSYFIRIFRKHYGMTPREYQQLCRGNQGGKL